MAGNKDTVQLSAEVRRLAALPIRMVIATKRADGSVQLNPIWFKLENGQFVVNSNTRRAWPANLQREKEATLLLIDPEVHDRYAQIRARLVDAEPDPDVRVIDSLAHRYTGRKFRALEPGEERITFRLEPFRVTGDLI